MKKIILFVSLLVFGCMAYGEPVNAERATWGDSYAITPGTILYYNFPSYSPDGGNVICNAMDYPYKQAKASFEVISDNLTWSGAPPGIYQLTSLNGYKITLNLIQVKRTQSQSNGNLIIISKSNTDISFIFKCGYTQ